MNTNPLAILSDLTRQLNALAGLEENDPAAITEAIHIVSSTISQVNAQIMAQPFSGEEEEIKFFKKIKPELDGRLIFYLMLLRVSECSVSAANIESSVISKQLKRIDQFYKAETAFYLYYKMGRTYLDSKYFLRQSAAGEFPYDEEHVHFDFHTNTYMSAKAARIVAYELFREHIKKISLPSAVEASAKKTNESEPILKWTASVADLVEFIYSAHEYGLFGKAIKVSTVVNFLSKQFGIKITNVYKTWEDIRLRKKDKTPFLRSLLTCLERRIDHDNEFAP